MGAGAIALLAWHALSTKLLSLLGWRRGRYHQVMQSGADTEQGLRQVRACARAAEGARRAGGASAGAA